MVEEELKEVQITENPFVEKFEEFFKTQNVKKLVEKLIGSYPDKKSLLIDFRELEQFDYKLADELLENPDNVLEGARIAVQKIDVPALEIDAFAPHIRFYNLPKDATILIRDVSAKHLNKLIAIEGVIRQFNQVQPKLKMATWKCRRCSNTYRQAQDGFSIKQPSMCECKHRDFELVEAESTFINHQKIGMQEPLEKLKGSEQATTLDVHAMDDLVNRIAPGDKTLVAGILRLYPPQKDKHLIYGRYIEALSIQEKEKEFEEVEVSKEEEEEIKSLSKRRDIFELLRGSVAPSIYGHEMVKDAVVLQLFNGVKKMLPGDMRVRGNIHILLVGDPGCLIADERVVLGNGAIERIGKLGKEHLQDIKVQVLTGEGMKQRDFATCFHAYKSQPVIEIITESGKSIKGTLNHPLLCVSKESGKVKRDWKRLDEFKIGDKVATATSIPCTITAELPTGFKPLEYNRGPRFKGKLPKKYDKRLAGFLGYLLGDGWVDERRAGFVVAEGEKDILPKLLKNAQDLFGIRPIVEKRMLEGRTVQLHYASLNFQDIARNISFLKEKRVPEQIMRSGNKVAAEFIKWLFEADGCVFCKGRGRRAIALKAKNIELLRDVQMLLLRFAVHSRIVGNALAIRRGKDMIKFAKSIGFVSKKKKQRLKELAKEAKKFARFNPQRSERITKIIMHGREDVFDIEVPKSHRFIANGVISHNTGKSQILKSISQIAPKSVYTSGKTSTSAGLTATAEKDEFGEGGWTLKAGALVLASGGMAMIDEFDKMETQDRSSMHEAMEQGTVSVAKAGIITTFKTDTSILAAANPKYSRFDPYLNLIEQVDLPPTLISRFDLYFMIRDVLDRKRDEATADFILKKHQRGEVDAHEKTFQRKVEDIKVEKDEEERVQTDLLRKYFSYARQKCFPIMTDDALKSIREFYLSLRDLGRQEKVFTATHRQLEALVRLSEASARVRLKDFVEEEDTARAIKIFRASLEELALDKETGKFDIDLITSGQASSKTNLIKKIMAIINERSDHGKTQASIDEVAKAAAAEGIDEQKAHDLISELKKKGDLYEPAHGWIKPTERKN